MPDTPSASVVPLTESSSSSPAPSRHSTWVDHLRGTVARQGEAPALTFLGDGENESIRLTYASLDEKARAIASHLQAAQIAPGQRVLLLYPSGVEFVAALFGCLYAGVIAVPAFPPRLNRNLLRLQCIFEDALPAMVFTTTAMLPKREASPEMQSVPWVPTDTLPLHAATDWTPPDIGLHSIAFLQYTSGSTSLPKGVIVTHASLMANHEMLLHAFAQDRTSTFVVWLPLFHDMGLIGNVLQALYLGAHCVLMPPEAFVIKPIRWLQAISRYKAHTSGGPNFAYDLCVRKIAPSQLEGLDLRCWKIAFNGAEPVRAESLQNFHRAFASAGFAESSLYPCYGLAEATLFVAGGPPGEPPFIPPGEGTPPVSKVSCGHAWTDGEIRIVDPASHEEVAPGTSGEIWLRGSHIAAGYWNHPEETRHTFQARLAHSSDPEYLRTGDLGFVTGDGLFIEGRLKDLMIIAGENHHPNDVEQTLEASHPRLRPHSSAAFSISSDGSELLIAMAEVGRPDRGEGSSSASTPTEMLHKEILMCARRDIAEQHGIRLHELVLLPPMALPKTSSGKIQRNAARQLYLTRQYTPHAS